MEPTEDTLPAGPAVADTSPGEPDAAPSTAPEVEATESATEADEAPETTAEGDTESDTPPDELKKRDWRQQDYTRKTQELAEQRKALETAREEFNKLRDARLKNADNAIQLAARTLQADFARVDWNTLAQTDPAGYVQKQHEFAVRHAELNQAWQALQGEQAEKERESTQARQKRMAEQESALLDTIPDWRDPVKRAAETSEFVALARKSSVSDAELEWISENGSAGLVAILRDGMRFRKNQQQIPKAKPVPQAPPPPPKLASKATGTKSIAEMTDAEFAAYRKRQIAQRR